VKYYIPDLANSDRFKTISCSICGYTDFDKVYWSVIEVESLTCLHCGHVELFRKGWNELRAYNNNFETKEFVESPPPPTMKERS